MAKSNLRVVTIGDFHCGHTVGLTPPQWQSRLRSESTPTGRSRNKLIRVQKTLWKTFAQMIEVLRPIDILVLNADLIDGKGIKSGGTEQTYIDLNDQAQMAVEIIQWINAKKIYMTKGTGYHVAPHGEDIEEQIANTIEAEAIEDQLWLDFRGNIFDVRHHINTGKLPHTKHGGIAREYLTNLFLHQHQGFPRANIILRSHVHFHTAIDDPQYLAMTLPALQGRGSKFGRRLSNEIHFGVVHFDISKNGDFSWHRQLSNIKDEVPKIIRQS